MINDNIFPEMNKYRATDTSPINSLIATGKSNETRRCIPHYA